MNSRATFWMTLLTIASACPLSACFQSGQKDTAQAEAAADATAAVVANNATTVQAHNYVSAEYLVMHPHPTIAPLIVVKEQPVFNPAKAAAAKPANIVEMKAIAEAHAAHLASAPGAPH